MQQLFSVSILSVIPLERLISSKKLPFPPTLTKFCSSISAFPMRAVQDSSAWPKRCCGGLWWLEAQSQKWRNGHGLLFMLFTKVIEIELSSLSIKPLRGKWGYLSFEISESIPISRSGDHSASETRGFSELPKFTTRQCSSQNHLSPLTIFTPWITIKKITFQTLLWSLGTGGKKAAIHIRKKAHRQNQLAFGWSFKYHLSASNAFLKAVTFFSHFMFTVGRSDPAPTRTQITREQLRPSLHDRLQESHSARIWQGHNTQHTATCFSRERTTTCLNRSHLPCFQISERKLKLQFHKRCTVTDNQLLQRGHHSSSLLPYT